MGNVRINGRDFSGNDIIIKNGVVTIDGVDATPNDKHIDITVYGNVERLLIDSCDKILVTESVRIIDTGSGNVDVRGTVTGDIRTTSGDVACGDVGGNVNSTSGNITCNDVMGSVQTASGNIKKVARKSSV